MKKSTIICGGPGTGKSHIAQAIINSHNQNNIHTKRWALGENHFKIDPNFKVLVIEEITHADVIPVLENDIKVAIKHNTEWGGTETKIDPEIAVIYITQDHFNENAGYTEPGQFHVIDTNFNTKK